MTDYLQITDDDELERTLGAIDAAYLSQRADEEGVPEGESFERYAGARFAGERPEQTTARYTEAIRDPDGKTAGGLIEVDAVVAALHGVEAKVPIKDAEPIAADVASIDYTVEAKPDDTIELTHKGTGEKIEAVLRDDGATLVPIERVTIDTSAKKKRAELDAAYEAVLQKRDAGVVAKGGDAQAAPAQIDAAPLGVAEAKPKGG